MRQGVVSGKTSVRVAPVTDFFKMGFRMSVRLAAVLGRKTGGGQK